MTGVSLRAETPADIPAITALINAAFANLTHSDQREAQIVDLLRQEDALVVSLVAERDGDLLGHVAASPVTLSDGSRRWFGIGPCLLYTSPSPRDKRQSRMPSSA